MRLQDPDKTRKESPSALSLASVTAAPMALFHIPHSVAPCALAWGRGRELLLGAIIAPYLASPTEEGERLGPVSLAAP